MITPTESKSRGHYERQSHPEFPRVSPYFLAMRLRTLWPKFSQEFISVFQYQKEENAPIAIESACFCAIGAAAEIKVLINKTQIKYQFKIENTIIFTNCFQRASPSLCYPALFKNLSTIVKKAKKIITQHFQIMEEDQKTLCFFGGWKSLKITESYQEIAIFTLPKMTLSQKDGLEVWQFVFPDVPLFSLETINLLPVIEDSSQPRLKVSQITNTPEHADYLEKLNRVLENLRDSSKIVLSQKKSVLLTETPDPLEISFLLAKDYGQVYDYSFQWNTEKLWFGVSPEILLQKSERHIITKPLAGTRKRHKEDGIQDIANFINDPKENLEHKLAVDQMMLDLKDICEYEKLINYSEKNVLHLSYTRHIKSEIYGYLKEENDTFDVLSNLYPPATIWGIPKEWSEQIIADFEPFERSFFTGGLGYFTWEDESNFALVIRSGYLEGNKLEIFAGGGIVKNSIPQLEWEEAQAKMTPFLSLLDQGTSASYQTSQP